LPYSIRHKFPSYYLLGKATFNLGTMYICHYFLECTQTSLSGWTLKSGRSLPYDLADGSRGRRNKKYVGPVRVCNEGRYIGS
jgi:hypothetical protein